MNVNQNLVSFVIPCYCSQQSIRNVVLEIISEVEKHKGYDYEIILVNDCSKDDTLDEIVDIAKGNNRVVAVDFSRNFGQASAMMAGFNEVKGNYIVSLDDDGQMPIESVFELIAKLDEGYDVAFGSFDELKQPWYRRLGSWMNLKMTEVLLGLPKQVRMSSFWAGKRYVIDEILKYDGAYPYIGGLLLRVTKNMITIPVKHRDRSYGTSGYTFIKLISLWMNGFTAFSVVPLRIATYSGMLFSIIGFILGIIVVIKKLLNPAIVMGYASIITTILFMGGIIMMMLGIVGEYVGRTYISINKAPQYVVKNKWDNRDY